MNKKNILLMIACLLMGCLVGFAQEKKVPLPTPSQLAWQNAEMGVVFHYDLHVFDGLVYGQGNNRINPIEDYNIFNPTRLDTDQWVQAAKAAGAKFAILTATHETGFGLWQSDVNPYCLKAVKWRDGKGDVVRDFVTSCRKYGLRPGIYIGIRWNSLLGIHNFKAEGDDGGSVTIRGVLKNDRDEILDTLHTLHAGMGVVHFTPRTGESCYAECTMADGKTRHFDLPPARPDACVLKVLQTDESFTVQVQSARPLPDDHVMSPLLALSPMLTPAS